MYRKKIAVIKVKKHSVCAKDKQQEFRYNYLLNLLNKQVQYQHLNAEKGNCLIAIDVSFIGAVIAITQFVIMPTPATVIMLVSLLSIMISFFVCIIHIRPSVLLHLKVI